MQSSRHFFLQHLQGQVGGIVVHLSWILQALDHFQTTCCYPLLVIDLHFCPAVSNLLFLFNNTNAHLNNDMNMIMYVCILYVYCAYIYTSIVHLPALCMYAVTTPCARNMLVGQGGIHFTKRKEGEKNQVSSKRSSFA